MVSKYAGTAEFTKALFDRDSHLIVSFIRGHLLLEQALTTILELQNDRAKVIVERATFSSKLTMCDGLGLLDEDLVRAIRAVNRERNRIAHRLDASLKASDVEHLVKTFAPELQKAVFEIADLTPNGSGRTSELINAVFLLLSMGAARAIQRRRYEVENRDALAAYRMACAVAEVQGTGVTPEEIAERLGLRAPPDPAHALGELFPQA